MDSGKLWYYLGATVGVVMRIVILVMCIYGFVTQIWNHEVPYIPVILFLVYQSWAKIYVIYEAVVFLARNPPRETLSPSEIERLVNLINFKNLHGGGPN